jgi:hypothetical protein
MIKNIKIDSGRPDILSHTWKGKKIKIRAEITADFLSKLSSTVL